MATAAYAISEELTTKFETWLQEKLTSGVDQDTAAAADTTLITNYIVNMLSEEDTSNEEKSEAIRPLLEELNQENSGDNDKLLDDIVTSWNKMRLEDEAKHATSQSAEEKKAQESLIQPGDVTDTILTMINKHKTQFVTEVKKPDPNKESSDRPEYAGYVDEPSSDEEGATVEKGGDDLFANTNSQDAQNRDKVNRDKMAESHKKQKEQTAKAAVEQKQKELDKKKKAQAKVAKVERKR